MFQVLQEFFNVTNYDRTGQYMSGSTLTFLWAVTVSIYAVGGMFGGLSGGYLANRYGRYICCQYQIGNVSVLPLSFPYLLIITILALP